MGNQYSNQSDDMDLSHLSRNRQTQATLQNIYRNNSNPPVQLSQAIIEGVDIETEQFSMFPPSVKKASPLSCGFMIDKHSLKLHPTADPTVGYLTFKFNSTKDVSISIFTEALDILDENYNTLRVSTDLEKYPYVSSMKFNSGINQEFPENAFTMDTKLYAKDNLTKVREHIYPLIIIMETVSKENENDINQLEFEIEKLYTYCIFKQKDDEYKVKVVQQKFERNGKTYILNEVYEIGPDLASGSGKKECTICLDKSIDTVILPCRHMFLCSECAKDFRKENQKKCSICRKLIRTYVRMNKNEK